MVISDVPIIDEVTRDNLRAIVEQEFERIKEETNALTITAPHGEYIDDFHYDNYYVRGKNNVLYDYDGTPIMCIFDFSPRAQIKIFKILNLTDKRPTMSAVRVFPNTVVPIHIDLNKGGHIGRNHAIYSIVTNGNDGYVYMSNRTDGSKQVIIPGKSQFVMYPTSIAHGAKSGNEPYTLLQLQLTGEMGQ